VCIKDAASPENRLSRFQAFCAFVLLCGAN